MNTNGTYQVNVNGTMIAQSLTVKQAETLVNKIVAERLNGGNVTGGRMADWKAVTLYFGSIENQMFIQTVKAK